jgi:hypothetical protein
MTKRVTVDFNGFAYEGVTEAEKAEAEAKFEEILKDKVNYKTFSDAVAGVFAYWRLHGWTIVDDGGFENLVVGVGLNPVAMGEDFAIFTIG